MTAIAYDCASCDGSGKTRGGIKQNARTGKYEVCRPRRCTTCNGSGRVNVYRVAGAGHVTPATVRAIARGEGSARSCRRFLRFLPSYFLEAS
jgi:poly(3-hydroxybutyrate) depolymerase